MGQPWRAIIAALLFAFTTACRRLDEQLQQHREKFESLAASAEFIGDAWLSGSTSNTYTATALSQTFLLVEKERATLASTPDALIDRRGAELSDSAEALARVIAGLLDDVRGADPAALRQRLAAVPFAPPKHYGRNR
jgi:hypothetical protein